MFLNYWYKKIVSLGEIFKSVESLNGDLCIQSYTFCLYFILHLPAWIRFHKGPKYGSNLDSQDWVVE